MFDKNNDQRLQAWSEFRKSLETSSNPIQDVLDFYSQSPIVSIHTDPWDETVWPTPWELVQENQYCEFCIVLGMCYSLQLTDRFSQEKFEIHIGIDNKRSKHYYLLVVGDRVLGFTHSTHEHVDKVLKDLEPQQIHHMPPLN